MYVRMYYLIKLIFDTHDLPRLRISKGNFEVVARIAAVRFTVLPFTVAAASSAPPTDRRESAVAVASDGRGIRDVRQLGDRRTWTDGLVYRDVVSANVISATYVPRIQRALLVQGPVRARVPSVHRPAREARRTCHARRKLFP